MFLSHFLLTYPPTTFVTQFLNIILVSSVNVTQQQTIQHPEIPAASRIVATFCFVSADVVDVECSKTFRAQRKEKHAPEEN